MLKLSKNAIGMLISKYRVILKNMSLKNSAALLLSLSLFCAAPVWADDITYTGDSADLKTNTIGGAGSGVGSVFLYPAGASDNNVTVYFTPGGAHTNPYRIYGGLSDSAAVTGNTVYFRNGATDNNVYGGYDVGGFNAVGNKVFMSGGKVDSYLTAGISLEYGNAIDNSVDMSGGTANYVYGGNAFNYGNAENNIVNIEGGTVGTVTISGGDKLFNGGLVIGGYSEGGNAIGNTVLISGGTVNNIRGGESNDKKAVNNSIFMSGGKVEQGIFGGRSTKDTADENIVFMSGGIVEGNVYGGWSDKNATTDNNVSISDGAVVRGDVYGGYSDIGTATGNSVFMSGGEASGVYGGRSNNGAVTGNSVTISGGTVNYDVYGGYSFDGAVTDNSVTISGSPDMTNIGLYGGFSSYTGDAFTGNTLNINGFSGSVAGVYNFENYNLFLPSTLSNNALLTVGSNVDLDGTNITMTGIAGGGTALNVGESITLIDQASGSLATTNGTGVQKGFSLLYDFDINVIGGALLATVTGAQAAPQAKPFSEGRAAGLSFLRQGADLVSGDGLKNAWRESKEADGKKASFSALEAGSSKYKTGSHVDVDGVSLLTGIASRRATKNGDIMTGVFLEAGWGSYDSYNSFTNYPSVNGGGDTNYYGLGFLARAEKETGAYSEGSLRFGRTKTDFDSGDLRNLTGQNVRYDSSSNYWGAHLGIGKIKTSGKNTLDVYGKYLFTSQGGDDVNISGDPISFSGSTSHRLKTGFRMSRENSDTMTTYAGAAYEYEFDGKSKATTYGYDIDAPSVKGSTGILELGVKWKKGANGTLEVGLLGYVGKRQGVSGTLQYKHMF